MFRRLFNRRLGRTLLWVLAILCVAVGINMVDIRFVGGVDNWNTWLESHRGQFLGWRVCVYGATAYGWWWMRERVRQREPDSQTRVRLRRAEIAAVLAILALEGRIFWP